MFLIKHSTHTFAKRIPDSQDLGERAVIMDGTYMFTQEMQTDYNIRKQTCSGQKSATGYDSLLIVTTLGYVVCGGGVYSSDIQHPDTNIQKLVMNEC